MKNQAIDAQTLSWMRKITAFVGNLWRRFTVKNHARWQKYCG
ncbi:hypothetical protein EATG_02223 [Escherichia coli H605]|uniref:Uncharacterized protein n=1 Tax=Escherichia coli H605 TaxID=656410 RepID=A0AAJ3TZ65_ECOLX|nr:hypothetical protein AC26_3318 [Escherichia coli 1-176-05_S3_C2]OSL47136.1 hypothetical protein EATG_02223 [Escherichia coli H605]